MHWLPYPNTQNKLCVITGYWAESGCTIVDNTHKVTRKHDRLEGNNWPLNVMNNELLMCQSHPGLRLYTEMQSK